MVDFRDQKTYAQTRLGTEEATTIDPRVYYDEDYHRIEKEQIFQRYWIAAGPASKVRCPGDLMVAEVADQSILITRNKNRELKAFYNVCRHRGTQLCAESGRVGENFVCPYHGWAYDLDGNCVGTPLFDKGTNRKVIEMHDTSHLKGFDKKNFGLFPVRVVQWAFMIFICLDEAAPEWHEMLGDLDARLENFRLDAWLPLAERSYDIRCDWKLLIENAMEYYHLPWVHPRLAKTSKVSDHHRWQGPGLYTGICTYPVTTTEDSDWLNMKAVPGLSEEQRVSGYFFSTFPNLIVFIMPSHAFVILCKPDGTGKTIETAWLFSHPECIENSTSNDIDAVMEFWNEVNVEDVEICEKVQKGLRHNVYPGGRMCYHFEEPVHRFQNMVIDALTGVFRIPEGDVDARFEAIELLARRRG